MIFGLLGKIFGLLGKIFGLLGTQQTENIYPTDRKKLPNRPKKYLLKIFGLLGKIFGLLGFGLMGFGLVGFGLMGFGLPDRTRTEYQVHRRFPAGFRLRGVQASSL